METIPPAHAEDQITAVADCFDAWRQTRTTRVEPIPPHLWEQAIALTTMFPLTRVDVSTLFRTQNPVGF